MPVHVRYTWPNELDAMAQIAGLEMKKRWADWSRAPFISTSRAICPSTARVRGKSGDDLGYYDG